METTYTFTGRRTQLCRRQLWAIICGRARINPSERQPMVDRWTRAGRCMGHLPRRSLFACHFSYCESRASFAERKARTCVLIGLFGCCLLLFIGCGPAPATVDDTPFREAIGQYVQANNMAMKIKEIKQAPTISDNKARLQASMTHEQLGGPAVTWDFEFNKETSGKWRVVRHAD